MTLQQLANDPDDPRLSTHEYEFLYKMYNGVWRRHVDRDDEFFSNIWNYINSFRDAQAKFDKEKKWLDQFFIIGDVTYRATWTDCSSISKLEGPPNHISWENEMLPPCHVQKSLF